MAFSEQGNDEKMVTNKREKKRKGSKAVEKRRKKKFAPYGRKIKSTYT